MDKAGAKGTGKWMSQLALDLGVPSTLVTEAVYARCLSALKDARVRASKVLQRPVGQVRRRPQGVHRADSPRALRLEDLQLRPGLRADAGGGERAQVAAQLRRLCAAVARRLHHPGRVPRSHQGSVRRESEAGEPAARPVFQQGGARGAGLVAKRGGDGRPARHSGAGVLRRALPTTTATAASGCPRTCSRPSATISALTPTSGWTSRAPSTPTGSANAAPPKK